MKKLIEKTKEIRGMRRSESKESIKTISEEVIRRRAFELYLENGDSPYDELDNWNFAEREWTAYYQ